MKNVRDALSRMFKAHRLANKYAKVFEPYDSPFSDIADDIADSIYYLIGEDTETFEESVTANVLGTSSLTVERAVALLEGEYKRNIRKATQPAPNTIEPDEFKQMFEETGGYMNRNFLTPEGEWK